MAEAPSALETKYDPTDLNEAHQAAPANDYFTSKTEVEDVPEDGQAPRKLLSRQVTNIIDEMSSSDESESSDADDESGDRTEPRRGSFQFKQQQLPQNTPPKPSDFPVPKTGSDAKPAKPPHAPRFHSLRSMLFSTHLAENEAKIKEHHHKERHDKHKSPTSADSFKPSEPSRQDSFSTKLTNKLKRMSSSRDQSSSRPTSSSAEAAEKSSKLSEKKADDEPQDQRDHGKEGAENSSREDSLSPDQVDDLVRWVSKKSEADGTTRGNIPQGSSSGLIASTSSLSDASNPNIANQDGYESLGDEHVDEIVRWVSRKDPDNARGSKSELGSIDEKPEAEEEQGKGKRFRDKVKRLKSSG